MGESKREAIWRRIGKNEGKPLMRLEMRWNLREEGVKDRL